MTKLLNVLLLVLLPLAWGLGSEALFEIVRARRKGKEAEHKSQ